MGIDYSSNFGIGYRVIIDSEVEDPLQWIDDVVPEGYQYFETGDSYSGTDEFFYVVIKNPLSGGLDLTEKKKALDAMLAEKNIKTEGEFGLVGGLRVW